MDEIKYLSSIELLRWLKDRKQEAAKDAKEYENRNDRLHIAVSYKAVAYQEVIDEIIRLI